MYNYLTVGLLFFLSLLPSFDGKSAIEQKLRDDFASEKVITSAETKKIQVPDKKENFNPENFYADSIMFSDYDTGYIFYQKNADLRLPIASTTKLMTALIIVEKTDMDKVVTVGTLRTRPFDSVMGLEAGDRLTVSELLHGLLIESGADAAQVLETSVANSEAEFVALMNERASELGLTETQFTNSVGYDDTGHYSTAIDMTKLAKISLLNPKIAAIVQKISYTARNEKGGTYLLSNTNKLLDGVFYKGVKTGTTYSAGECLISLYQEGDSKIIGVVLGSPARFTQTNNIITWTKNNFVLK